MTNHSVPGAEQFVPDGAGLERLAQAVQGCRGCELYRAGLGATAAGAYSHGCSGPTGHQLPPIPVAVVPGRGDLA